MTDWRQRSELPAAVFVFAVMTSMAFVMIGGIVFGFFTEARILRLCYRSHPNG